MTDIKTELPTVMATLGMRQVKLQAVPMAMLHTTTLAMEILEALLEELVASESLVLMT